MRGNSKQKLTDAAVWLAVLVIGFLAAGLYGSSFGVNGEGGGVSVITVLLVYYTLFLAPAATLVFLTISWQKPELRLALRIPLALVAGVALSLLAVLVFIPNC